MKLIKRGLVALSLLAFIACDTEVKQNNTNEETSATKEFSDLANEEGFAEMHDEPLKINVDAKGEMQKINVEGGEAANIYSLKNEKSNNYLIVIHEWWGLNNQIINVADKSFKKLGNTNVIALDLYDGKLATTREKATEYMQGADEERIKAIISSVLKSLPENANVATVGWCFGGGWSLKTAIMAGNKTKGCVMYYGMPVKDVEILRKLNSNVLFIYGNQDEWINSDVANEFEKNMEAAGKQLTISAFDADHAFANPTSERYMEKAAKTANKEAFNYLKEAFK